MPHYFSLV
ncbi:hypothetical protein YPPY54_1806, partial [Yersinia pestis PY-54]